MNWLKKIDWQVLGFSVGIILLSFVILVGLAAISGWIPITIILILLTIGLYGDIKNIKETYKNEHADKDISDRVD